MSLLSTLARRKAVRRMSTLRRYAMDPTGPQARVLAHLLKRARGTAFGRDVGLASVRTKQDFQSAVPITDYSGMEPWWTRARHGEADVSWPGRIPYFGISSGTTAGEKYLPISAETIKTNKRGGFDAIAPHLAEDASLLGGKLLFLGGTTTLQKEGHAWIGDNTGIMGSKIPWFFARKHTPGPRIAAMGDWGKKIEAAAKIGARQDVRMLGGIPSWLILYGEAVLEEARRQGKQATTLKELWPQLSLVAHGGTAFQPYAARMQELLGEGVRFVDSYSATEGGFLGVQDERDDPAMLPLPDLGVFYEFVPVEEVGNDRPTRHLLHEVQPEVDYALGMSTNAGIWGYLVGDIVRFTSVRPYRFVFAGRLAHTMNAFGEHLSGPEIDRAVLEAAEREALEVGEFSVAARWPDASSPRGGHRYYIEGEIDDAMAIRMADTIDRRLQSGSEDYKAHRSDGYALDRPEVVPVERGAFYAWMKARGRYGGQNKVPRVLNPELDASLREHLHSSRGL